MAYVAVDLWREGRDAVPLKTVLARTSVTGYHWTRSTMLPILPNAAEVISTQHRAASGNFVWAAPILVAVFRSARSVNVDRRARCLCHVPVDSVQQYVRFCPFAETIWSGII